MRETQLGFGLRRCLTLVPVLGLLFVISLSQSCKSKTEEERLAEAQKALDERNVIGAELMLKEFLEKFPESPNAMRARFDLSQAYFMDRDYVKCRELLDEIVKISGGVDTQTGLNAAMLKLDTYLAEDNAKAALDEAVATSGSLKTVNPEFRQFLNLKTAELFNRNGRGEDSIAMCRALLSEKAEPRLHLDAMRILSANFMKDKRVDDFIASHLDYINANPNSELNMLFRLEIAQVLEQEGRSAEAAPYFDQVEAQVQETLNNTIGADAKIQLAMQLSQIKEARRKSNEAREILEGVISEFPMSQQTPNAMRLLAEIHFRAGEKNEGNAMLDKIAATYPNTPFAVQAVRRKQEFAAAEAKGLSDATTGTLNSSAPSENNIPSETPSADPAQ